MVESMAVPDEASETGEGESRWAPFVIYDSLLRLVKPTIAVPATASDFANVVSRLLDGRPMYSG